jgi:hypothetical protein
LTVVVDWRAHQSVEFGNHEASGFHDLGLVVEESHEHVPRVLVGENHGVPEFAMDGEREWALQIDVKDTRLRIGSGERTRVLSPFDLGGSAMHARADDRGTEYARSIASNMRKCPDFD